jgi:hypothetical protein
MANGIKNATIYAALTWCLNLSTADRTAYSQRTFKAEEELMERLGCGREQPLCSESRSWSRVNILTQTGNKQPLHPAI